MTFTLDQPLRLCVFGAGPGTGNLGVSALSLSLLSGIARRVRDPQVTSFDNGKGIRPARARLGGRDLAYRLCGAIPTRRVYRRDSLFRIRASGWFGGLGHAAIKVIRDAHAVLDCTSGDSFTDLYSRRRFRLVTAEKMLALEQRRPLILLPQTIGPFTGARTRRIARRIVRAAAMVWARDQRSFSTLRELLDGSFDASRHHCGVDLAFGLEAQEPTQPLPEAVASWLTDRDRPPLVGFNVSGLIHGGDSAVMRFGLRTEYFHAVTRFLKRILDETDANILLVPHVFSRPGHFEHDPDACASVAARLGQAGAGRIARLPEGLSPGKTKWAVSRTDWFCGTRMHASIAAISSGVPAAAMAYSDKTLGVFETCGQGEHVADLRHLETDEVVDRLWESWTGRANARASLEVTLPKVQAQVEDQMDRIVECCAATENAK
ncbi:MAG: polysaccharide pyruvyl transferase family protein [Planctomycetota bacterium]|jgi:polysaccharide pyruvyl transferase WcaK-like protein